MVLAAVVVCLALGLQQEVPGDSRIRTLIEQLGADFLEEREPARKELEKAGKSAEARLVEGLSHPDHRVRRACLELLTPLKSTSALRRGSDLFAQDEDLAVREAAFHLLQGLGKDAEDAIIGALSSPNSEFRRGAVQSLASIQSVKAVARIADLYDRETDKGVKEAAWKCLLASGKAAEPHLRKYLRDPDPAVRRDALQSLLGSTEEETLTAVIGLFAQEADDAPLDQAYVFLLAIPARAEPAFLAGLKSPRQSTRLKSIMGLKSIPSPKGLEPISEIFLGECPPDVRSASADYLKTQGAAAEEVLLKGLDSKENVIRLSSIQVLGEIGSQKALDPVGRL
ncbi:MAG: HEAT repeat domain-containing protein, partial [Planctomycetaceae bacterium]|nr:HEAT repeat domain-containing protein [Planctomycetaceae bacterium]